MLALWGKDRSGSKMHASAPYEGLGIALHDVTKRFGTTTAVDRVTLTIQQGEFFAVLGPSGCGKSTLLRLIAGLETLDGGAIHLAGRRVAGHGQNVSPEARDVAVVFQSYALWPHMSVAKNVAFPAQAKGLPRKEVERIAARAVDAVALTAFSTRKPASLSGGQQQRVALARCLASEARTVLMDEPLANLDPHLRAAMEDELRRVHAASCATTLYITHDQREAMALADRVAVMQAGKVLQVAPPDTLYDQPANVSVARFIGRGTLIKAPWRRTQIGKALVHLADACVEAGAPATLDGPALLFVRPHQVRLGEGPFMGTIGNRRYRGGHYEIEIDTPTLPRLVADATARPPDGPVPFAINGGWLVPMADDPALHPGGGADHFVEPS